MVVVVSCCCCCCCCAVVDGDWMVVAVAVGAVVIDVVAGAVG